MKYKVKKEDVKDWVKLAADSVVKREDITYRQAIDKVLEIVKKDILEDIRK